ADSKTRWVISASPCDGADRGHADLLLAFASLARTRPALRLLLAGSGPDSRSLMDQIEHAGLRGRAFVHHTTIDHLPGLFTRAASSCPRLSILCRTAERCTASYRAGPTPTDRLC